MLNVAAREQATRPGEYTKLRQFAVAGFRGGESGPFSPLLDRHLKVRADLAARVEATPSYSAVEGLTCTSSIANHRRAPHIPEQETLPPVPGFAPGVVARRKDLYPLSAPLDSL
jgi:hypothetical protein